MDQSQNFSKSYTCGSLQKKVVIISFKIFAINLPLIFMSILKSFGICSHNLTAGPWRHWNSQKIRATKMRCELFMVCFPFFDMTHVKTFLHLFVFSILLIKKMLFETTTKTTTTPNMQMLTNGEVLTEALNYWAQQQGKASLLSLWRRWRWRS